MEDHKDDRIEFLEFENALLKDVIDNVHEGIYAINTNDGIILYNKVVEEMDGLRREDILGKNENDVYSMFNGHNFSSYESRAKLNRKPVLEENFNYTLPNGKKINLIVSAFPFFYKGSLAAIYSIGRDVKQIEKFITRTLEVKKQHLFEENKGGQNGAKYFLDDIIGSSERMTEVLRIARKVATNDFPVLIIGETGVGKELFAQGIHNASLFNQGPFVPINCAAIPDSLLESLLFGTVKGAFTGATDHPGLFEQAKNGTVFLDEINSMPINLQPKLLRALEEKMVRRIGSDKQTKINCRILSSSNQDLFNQSKEMTIRSDLLYRLATIVISVPPLRERGQDIIILSNHFIKKLNNKYGVKIKELSEEVSDSFLNYHWPGNARELRNVIESVFSIVDNKEKQITMKHIPIYYKQRLLSQKYAISNMGEGVGTLKEIMWMMEKQVIEDALQKNDWNVSKTAREFGLLRQNLQQKIRHFQLKRPGN
jgi:arginine utilization regulatory protein